MPVLTKNVPIFPLSTVLFPEGVLALRIFEARYLDMVSSCLKQEVPFGVCMIVDGREVGTAARSYQLGTLAKISEWGQSDDGVLTIEAIGCQRFKILDSDISSHELITATIQVLPEPAAIPVPEGLKNLALMLKNVLKKHQPNKALKEEQFNDANWVGYRLAEVLSMENVMRQRLLEMEDPIDRLHMILGLFTNR
ncbi:MAG: LON peptidase substrate-binding domain-containing protein [Cycloclasticus sp.]